jgi:putative flippase GtrA
MQRLMRYAAVGAVATAAHYALLVLLVESGLLPAFAAAGAGAVFGAQVAYAGNRWFTFAHRGPLLASWLRFQSTAVIGALVGMAVVALGVHLGLYYLLAQLIATALSMLLTYAINRRWSFV